MGWPPHLQLCGELSFFFPPLMFLNDSILIRGRVPHALVYLPYGEHDINSL